MEEQILAIKKTIASLKDKMDSVKDQEPELKAKFELSLAFAMNSLVYSAIRAQGKVKVLEDHAALTKQTNDIKARFMKLNQVVRKRDQKAQRDEERQL